MKRNAPPSQDRKDGSYLLRRSGIAVALMLYHLDWNPRHVYHVGVGQNSKEIDVMRAQWFDEDGFELEGFEPHPVIYESIRDSYPGRLYPVALSDTIGETTLYSKKCHKDGSSLLRFHEEFTDIQEFTVPVTTLDQWYPAGASEGSMLWIDAEGSELGIVRGGRKFLERVEVVNVEMTGRPPCDGWPGTVELHELLVSLGFLRQWVHTSRFHAGQYDALYCRAGVWRRELCCCPCAIERQQDG